MELPNHRADVAELADALDSGSSARKGVEVRVLFSALILTNSLSEFFSKEFSKNPAQSFSKTRVSL